jgi:hypothetical protein
MRFLLKSLLWGIVLLPVAAIGLVWASLSDQPLITVKADIRPEDIERAKRILGKHDPRKAKPGTLRAIAVSQQDLDLLLAYGASRLQRGAARVVLRPGIAAVQASIDFAGNPLGRYLNVDAVLSETGALPTVDRLAFGRVPVPSFLANLAFERAMAWLDTTAEGQLAADVVKRVEISAGRLDVTYAWRDDTPDRLRAVLVAPDHKVRLRAYHDWLVEFSRAAKGRPAVSLAEWLVPFTELAQRRSADGNAANEHRAAILVLALYVNGRGLAAIVPEAAGWPRPDRVRVTLQGREDFPQHFLVSAAIAAEAGGPLSDAIGLYKEVADARGGSGFSFNDIAADRAGTRFGELAVRSPARFQARVRSGLRETDFMPDVTDLPEFMQEAEFTRRFGGIGGEPYRRMMADIEARIAARPVFQ